MNGRKRGWWMRARERHGQIEKEYVSVEGFPRD